jgi:hypothetical protein
VEETVPFETKKKRVFIGTSKAFRTSEQPEFQLLFKILPGRNQSI